MNKFQKFYAPDDDGGGTGNGPTGTVVLKVRGEDKPIDLSKPDELDFLIKNAQKGFVADEKFNQAAEAIRQNEYWNNLMNAAKSDPSARRTLRGAIEDYIGDALVSDPDPDDDLTSDASTRELQEIKRELAQIKKDRDQERVQSAAVQIESELDTLATKYPKTFDREAVVAKARELGVVRGFEEIHKMLTVDKQIEEAVEAERKRKEELAAKRRGAILEGGDTPPDSIKPRIRHNSMRDVSKNILAELKAEGKSLHIPDE